MGGRTFRLREGDEVHYLKVCPLDVPETHDLVREAERLAWIGARLPVPEVIDAGRTEEFSWMRTRALPGLPASDPRWLARPAETAYSRGAAIRQFHDALRAAVDSCPFDWRLNDRLHHGGLSDAAHVMAAGAPAEDDLVVAHGDMCAPNVLLSKHGRVGGFVDLGTMGIADRAADLGTGLWSLESNGLGDYVDDFLAAYDYGGEIEDVRWYRDFYAVG